MSLCDDFVQAIWLGTAYHVMLKKVSWKQQPIRSLKLSHVTLKNQSVSIKLKSNLIHFQRPRVFQALHRRRDQGLSVRGLEPSQLPRWREQRDGRPLRQGHHGELSRILDEAVLESGVRSYDTALLRKYSTKCHCCTANCNNCRSWPIL